MDEGLRFAIHEGGAITKCM